MTGLTAHRKGNGPQTSRTEALSDGVFAIAITLLVLEIKVPPVHEVHHGELFHVLLEEWPSFFAFLTSFATIGIMWMNHHRIFTLMSHADHRLIILNSLLLLGITFVPFPTALLAEYIGHPDQQTAALVYTGTFVLQAIVFNLLWRHASGKRRLLAPDVDPTTVDAISRSYLLGPIVYLCAFALVFVNALLSIAVCALLATMYALPERTKAARADNKANA